MRCINTPYQQIQYSPDNSLRMFDNVKTLLSDQYDNDKKTCRRSVSRISSYDLLSGIDNESVCSKSSPQLDIDSHTDTFRITVRFSPSVRVLHYDHTLPTVTCSHVQNCWGYESCGSGTNSDDTSCSVSRHSSCAGSASEDESVECNCERRANQSSYANANHNSNSLTGITEDTFDAVLKKSVLKTSDVHRRITQTEILRQERRDSRENVIFPAHTTGCRSHYESPTDSSDSDSDTSPKVQEITESNTWLMSEYAQHRDQDPVYTAGSSESFYNNAETLKPVQVMHCRYVRTRRAVVVNARINKQNCHGMDMSKPAATRCVKVRYTLDNWNTHEDTAPGVVIITSQVHTTYKITIPISDEAATTGAFVKFAMCLEANPTLAFWDNNNGDNFEVDVPRPAVFSDQEREV